MAFTTFDLASVGANVTLTNGNLTATSSNGATVTGARNTADKSAGLLYVEFTLTTAVSANTGVGIMLIAASFGSLSVNGLIYFKGGNIRLNGVTVNSTTGVPVSGNLICMALDLNNNLAWFRLTATGNWNGTAGNDPATGVGGISISSLFNFPFNPAYLAITLGATNDQITLNAGATAFIGTVPAGYAGWDTTTITYLGTTQFGGELSIVGVPALTVTQLGVEAVYSLIPNLVVTQMGVEVAINLAGATVQPYSLVIS